MYESKQNLLIIDDDPVYRKLSSSILKERFNVFTADAPSAGLLILRTKKIHYVICDYLLPEMDGLQLIELIKTEFSDVMIIVVSDSGNMDTVIEAMRKGAVDYFRKPFTPADIWMSIERSGKIAELNKTIDFERNKNKQLKDFVDKEFGVDIVGSSSQLQEIKNQMRLVAQTPDTSVLILGESGTGKELVARGIHNLSDRKNELFGAVNMSAIPEALFESEFFGHKKGSFTGAIADKSGWFETTNKGTLFLDEIGEMSQGLQVKLLRVLEDRTFVKVGTQNEQKFDIRIVAATNKQIQEITNGSIFRLDLFHRIATFIIYLPPLRERPEDVVELADYYAKKYSNKLSKNNITLHPESVSLLRNYSFPGNVRELRNMIERAVILCDGHELLPSHFFLINNSVEKKSDITVEKEEIYNLEEIEKQTIYKALRKCNFNKSEAAKLLNIEWNALYRRIQKYGILLENE
ncbi:MAG: sigma-54 dependent transcriptional regulator [Paludibacter sp.]|nr:sigma-54 dependent transcriptional regulator [Paludibacter sp.]